MQKGYVSPSDTAAKSVASSGGFCTARLAWITVISLIVVACITAAVVVPVCLTIGCAAAKSVASSTSSATISPVSSSASSAVTSATSNSGLTTSPTPTSSPSPSPTTSSPSPTSSPSSSLNTALSCAASFSTSTCTSYTSNYINRTGLSYSSSTGIFSGVMTSDLCPYNSAGTYKNPSLSCTTLTFPATAYSSVQSGTAKAASLRGAVAYSLKGGVNIFGPMDAGFNPGTVCTASTGCTGGTDVVMCFEGMDYQCNVTTNTGLDACGGHASPYHFHTDLLCDYALTASGHSNLIGIALDGRGLYGQYESTGSAPTDLDACNGHSGIVPSTVTTADSTGATQTFTASSTTTVYHYHTTGMKAPFTIGCFGPVSDLAACKALYPSTCGKGYVNVTTSTTYGARYSGTFINYDTDCPCFQDQYGNKYNTITLSTTGASQSTGH